MCSQQFFLDIPPVEVVVTSYQQELHVLGIHCDILRSFVSERPELENKGD